MRRRSWLVATLLQSAVVAVSVALLTLQGSAAGFQSPTQANIALATAVNQAREICYADPECPNLDALMALFSANARRTEIQGNNSVVLLEDPEALATDHLRVARSFTGRKLETTGMLVQGRNVVVLQQNWDPGSPAPNPFMSVFRIEDDRVAHWVLVAP